MNAVVFRGVGDIRIEDVPEPKIEQPTDVAPKTNPKDENWVPGDAPTQALRWAIDPCRRGGCCRSSATIRRQRNRFRSARPPQSHYQHGQLPPPQIHTAVDRAVGNGRR
jgi:hypothetical protein